MSSKTKIVCLANSRKLNERCIAGLRLNDNKLDIWVRPISQFGHGELGSERRYLDGSEPKLLDIIEFQVLKPKPMGCHVEDVLVDTSKHWSNQGTVLFSHLVPYAQPPVGPLWINGHSTRKGENDSIPAEEAKKLTSSLTLIQPSEVTLVATMEGMERPRRKVRGSFKFGRFNYTFAVTDPIIETEFASHPVGHEEELQDPLLCISIGEKFEEQNAHYKLIAGVMKEPKK